VSVGDITNAVAIAVGDEHTCALLSNGTVKCWGGNAKGQLGNGGTNTSTIPVPVSGITNAIAITAGAEHTCALLSDGTVKCWGRNDAGQLGDGTKKDSSTPVPVKDLTNAIAITAGGFHTCALLSNGTVKCWGWNAKGQLGDGTIATKVSPVQVQEQGNAVLKNVVAIKAGWVHTCALLSNGTVKCWGDNGSGQISVSYIHTSQVSTVALDVPDLKNAVAIAAGENHTCALLSNGTVKCWGGNNKGQLGNGTTQTSAYGTQVIEEGGSVLKNAVAIAAGAYHTCALLSGGIAKCWGSDEYGQLGDNDWRTTESLYAKNVYATFNFGGRYDKTNGIPATIQKPPYSDIYQNGDKYFIRAHAAPEPKVRLGEEQQVGQQTSDISLKKDIQPLNFGILDKVLRLNPVSFYWKDESIDKNKHFGFIAQEVEQVLPELVRQDFQGKKTLNYDEFIPYLVKAIQEQQQIIQKQQKEIEELKEMIKR
jgi:alpha-tubulin suppressor-like RCC1 family protein